jgi:hypothetical protein
MTPTPDPLLLVLDYPGRRREARVTDLGLDADGFRVRELLAQPLPEAPTAAGYARAVLGAHPAAERPAAILAYCSAAPLAGHCAALLAGQGAPPPLVLFDPEPATPRHIADAYADALRQVAERPPAAPALGVAALLDRPAELLGSVREDLVRRAAGSLRAEGISERAAAGAAADFARQHVAWLAHLLAARDPAPAPAGRTVHVLSADHPAAAPGTGGPQPDTVRVPCARRDLLAHPATRTAVLAFLRPSAPRPTARPSQDQEAAR